MSSSSPAATRWWSAPVSFSLNQSLQMSGTATCKPPAPTTSTSPTSTLQPGHQRRHLTAGGNFKIGNQAQTISANVNAATMTIGSGSATKITGTLTATGQITGLARHHRRPDLGLAVTTNSPVSLTGDVTASSSFRLASGSTLSGNLTAPTTTLDASSVTVTGNITPPTR
jgi:MSHA biogenesis protein MshQ